MDSIAGLSINPAIKDPNFVIPACPVTPGDSPRRESFLVFRRIPGLPKAFGIAGMTTWEVFLITSLLLVNLKYMLNANEDKNE